MSERGNQFISEIQSQKEVARQRTAKWRVANPARVKAHNRKFTRQFYAACAVPYTEAELAGVRQRFLAKVMKTESCWQWTGAMMGTGYGSFSFQKQPQNAHRVAYELFVAAPGTQHVLHRCDNPSCVNPEHLWLGTPADNADDRERKGRGRYGKVRQ